MFAARLYVTLSQEYKFKILHYSFIHLNIYIVPIQGSRLISAPTPANRAVFKLV